MFLRPGARVAPIRLLAAEELTQREWEGLRRALEAAVESWQAGAEVGIALERTLRAERPDQVPALPGAVTYRLTQAPVVMAVQAELAVALVCASLGAPELSQVDASLTPVDLRVLDATVGPALQALASNLRLGTRGNVERLSLSAREVAGKLDAPVVGGLLHSPRLTARAMVMIAQQPARQALTEPGPRLGDNPKALLRARVKAEARMRGSPVPLVDLLAAQEGDVVTLGGPTSRQVGLYVGDLEVASGRPGARGDHMAMRITDVVNLRAGGTRDGE